MFSRTVEYTNSQGKLIQRELWFHLTKMEIIKAELEVEGGMLNLITAMIDADSESLEGKKKIVQIMEEIVLRAYGRRVPDEDEPDDDVFLKSEDIRKRFAGSQAYEKIMDELAFGPQADVNMAEFIKNAFPADIVESSAKAIADAGGDVRKALEAAMKTEGTEVATDPPPPSFS